MLIEKRSKYKNIKKLRRILVFVFVFLLTFLFAIYTVIRIPSFQQLAGRMTADYLSRLLQTEVLLSDVRISDGLKLRLSGLCINDHHHQTMIAAEKVFIELDRFKIRKHELNIAGIELANPEFSLVQYEGDTVPNLMIIIGKLIKPGPADTTPSAAWKIYCGKLNLHEASFTVRNDNVQYSKEGIDFNNFLISGIDLDAEKISIIGDSISAVINKLNCMEKSGFEIKEFSGEAVFSHSVIRVDKLKFKTNESVADLDFSFSYKSFGDFSDFLDSVRIIADIRSTYLNLSDVGYFAPVMLAMNSPVFLSGKIEGSVSDFNADNFWFSFGEATEFLGDLTMKGLPDIYSTYAELNIDHLYCTRDDICKLGLPVTGGHLDLPEQLGKMGMVMISGSYAGYYNNFTANCSISSDIGSLTADADLSYKPSSEKSFYSGEVKADHLDLGKLLDDDDFGEFSMDAEFKGSGLSAQSFKVFVDGWIDSLEFRGHKYGKIIINGDLGQNMFNGRCMVMDDALQLDFNGLADFSEDTPRLDFTADLEKARFYDMNLSDRSNDMNLRAKMTVDVIGAYPDKFTGEINIEQLTYTENNKDYLLEHFQLIRSHTSGEADSIRIRSDYIDAGIEGNFQLVNLIPEAYHVILNELESPDAERLTGRPPQVISYEIALKNTDPLTQLLLPDLKISHNSRISGYFDSDKNLFSLEGKIDTLGYKGMQADALELEGSNRGGKTELRVMCSHLTAGRSGKTGDTWVGIANPDLRTRIHSDSLAFNLIWKDIIHKGINEGEISGYFKFPGGKKIEAGILLAHAIVNGEHWNIREGNLFLIDSSYLEVKDLVVIGNQEEFDLDGVLSDKSEDTLSFTFKNWHLSNFDPLISNDLLKLRGTLNGKIGFSNLWNSPNVFARLQVDSLNFNDTDFGSVVLETFWVNSDNAVRIDLELTEQGKGSKFKNLEVTGFYYPFSDVKNFDFEVSAHNLKLEAAASFLSSFSSDLSGLASGDLLFYGTFKKPVLEGKLNLQRAQLRIDYLNVVYSLSHEIVFNKDEIRFDDIEVYDPMTNRALCSGTLKHDYFRNPEIDLTLRPDNVMVMDLSKHQNSIFYGRAFATGTVRIFGPFDDLSIDIDATTNKGTSIFIPISYSVNVSQSDFIIFKGVEDTTMIFDEYKVFVKGFHLNLGINVTQDANIQLFLPSNMGYFKAKGDGKIQMGIDPRGYLTMDGTYRIKSGLFLLTLQQLIRKRFEIEEGSQIKWNGDIYDADVNIRAKYHLKTSLGGLGIMMIDPSSASQKVNVNCVINMSGNLFNPDLRFSIEFPNLDEQTRQTIYAALDTNDVAVMNEQAISLMVLNNFSSTGNASAPISSAAFLSNTLSNMLSKISNDFDVGINYIPGDQVSNKEIEVAVSTQLFNDRLSVNGNVGVSSNNSAQKTSSIVGDVNIEYKLTRDGRFRVKAFNRSNNVTILQDYSPYTQGVGILYRKEFNNLGELFRSEKKKKKQ